MLIVNRNASLGKDLLLAVDVDDQPSGLEDRKMLLEDRRSQRLILPPEACSQNWNIGQEPALNFAGVLAAKQQDTVTSRPHPSITRFRGN
jgi:hypothetical protein